LLFIRKCASSARHDSLSITDNKKYDSMKEEVRSFVSSSAWSLCAYSIGLYMLRRIVFNIGSQKQANIAYTDLRWILNIGVNYRGSTSAPAAIRNIYIK
jgi:hypothetical protein